MLLHLLHSIGAINQGDQIKTSNSLSQTQTNITELDSLILPESLFNNGKFNPPPSQSTGLNPKAYGKGYRDSNYTTPQEFLDPNAEAELHFIGVYEGQYPPGVGHSGKNHPQGTVTIFVKKSDKPIILALSSYESVNWNIVLEEGAELKEVITSGYYKQDITGLPENVKVTNRERGGAYTYGWETEHNRGGGNHEKAIDSIREFTGLREATFQGIYEGNKFNVGSGKSGEVPEPETFPEDKEGCGDPTFNPIGFELLSDLLARFDHDGKEGLSAQEIFNASRFMKDNTNLIFALRRLAIEIIKRNKYVDPNKDGNMTLAELKELVGKTGSPDMLELEDITSAFGPEPVPEPEPKPNPIPGPDSPPEDIIKFFIKEAQNIFRGKISDFSLPFDDLFNALEKFTDRPVTDKRKNAVIEFLEALKHDEAADTDGNGPTGIDDLVLVWKRSKFEPVAHNPIEIDESDDGGDDGGNDGGDDGTDNDNRCLNFGPVSEGAWYPTAFENDVDEIKGLSINELLAAAEFVKTSNPNMATMFQRLAVEMIKGNLNVDADGNGNLTIEEMQKLASRTGVPTDLEEVDINFKKPIPIDGPYRPEPIEIPVPTKGRPTFSDHHDKRPHFHPGDKPDPTTEEWRYSPERLELLVSRMEIHKQALADAIASGDTTKADKIRARMAQTQGNIAKIIAHLEFTLM